MTEPDSSSNVPPRTHGMRQIRAAGSRLERQVLLPTEEYLHSETISGALLLLCALVALAWANSPWSASYFALRVTPLSLPIGPFTIVEDLQHWINDGLMAIFFFVVALEVKREFLYGDLSQARKAALLLFPGFTVEVSGRHSAQIQEVRAHPIAVASSLAIGKGMTSMWQLGGLGWREVLRTLWRQFWEDKILDQAAMLSFYFLLSIFPLLIFLMALLGLMLQSDQALEQAIHSYLAKLVPASASGLIDSTLGQIRRGSSGSTLSFGLLFSLYMASSGVVAVMEALNVAYEVKESRSWIKQRLVALALTIGSALFMAVAMILLGYGDRIAALVAGHFEARSGLVTTGWTVLKWLLVLGFLLMAFNLLYIVAPNVKHRRWHWLMPGTVLGVMLWILVSYAFKLYLTFFNQYNLTYGSIGAVIILLMWFYFTGIAILLGGELNSEIEKQTRSVQKPATPRPSP